MKCYLAILLAFISIFSNLLKLNNKDVNCDFVEDPGSVAELDPEVY